ncbi:MAG: hypothetical protein AABY15_04400, partial [Nanoarchaeota archaeon]
ERPETVIVGANIVVGGNLYPNMIEKSIQMMANRNPDWEIPYSLGATKKMAEILKLKKDEIPLPKIWW